MTHKTAQKPFLYPRESYLIRGACFEVYKKLRNSQKESIYQNALLIELKKNGLAVEKEKRLPVYYGDTQVGMYIPDIVVNGTIVLELKAKSFLHREDIQQFWYYLKNSGFQLGFLINFGKADGMEILRRVYSKILRSSASSSA